MEYPRKKRFANAYHEDGTPKYVRCYDDGGPGDRYTVVFSRLNTSGWCQYLGMSGAPFHPQGVCMHGEHFGAIDRPTYGHLGKKITFHDLNEDCQKAVMQDYTYYWG